MQLRTRCSNTAQYKDTYIQQNIRTEHTSKAHYCTFYSLVYGNEWPALMGSSLLVFPVLVILLHYLLPPLCYF